jgi:transposase
MHPVWQQATCSAIRAISATTFTLASRSGAGDSLTPFLESDPVVGDIAMSTSLATERQNFFADVRMMRRRSKPVHLVVDGVPAHKTALVKAYVASTKGMLTLHFLPGYAPELNPDELVWSHMKRTGVARAPLRRGEKLKRSKHNLALSSACHGLYGHSSRRRVSPILPTGE